MARKEVFIPSHWFKKNCNKKPKPKTKQNNKKINKKQQYIP